VHGDLFYTPPLVGVELSPELGLEYLDLEAGAVPQLPCRCRENGSPERGLLLR